MDGDVVPVDAVVADVERSALEAMVTAFKRGAYAELGTLRAPLPVTYRRLTASTRTGTTCLCQSRAVWRGEVGEQARGRDALCRRAGRGVGRRLSTALKQAAYTAALRTARQQADRDECRVQCPALHLSCKRWRVVVVDKGGKRALHQLPVHGGARRRGGRDVGSLAPTGVGPHRIRPSFFATSRE